MKFESNESYTSDNKKMIAVNPIELLSKKMTCLTHAIIIRV